MLSTFFSKTGRIGRLKFIFLQIILFVVMFFCVIDLASQYDTSNSESSLVAILIFLLCAFSFLMIAAKRLHDFNASGWWIFVSMIFPFMLPILWVAMIIIPGSRKVNNYDFEEARSAMRPPTSNSW